MTAATSPDLVVSASGLTKHFGGVAALDDFSLAVADREIRCIVGPNGAGKSTLFKVLAGLLRPDAGRIQLLGSDVSRLNARQIARMGVATKLQIPRVFPSLTVREHLEIATRAGTGVPQLLGLRRRRESQASAALISELMTDLDLVRTRDRQAQELSHGQRQWLEIVMMLATQPRILLLDEPGAGMAGDEKGRTADLLRELAKRMAVVVIEHDLAFVQLIADSVIVMHRGRLLTQGSFDEISRDPQVGLVYLGSATA
ncbi:MAG: ATP-binding cassette domain-containing protein [Chloroflexota bacterium]|nr:MAG: ATP-binding cassette domain-containing protein [Chloroflexota bacterium]